MIAGDGSMPAGRTGITDCDAVVETAGLENDATGIEVAFTPSVAGFLSGEVGWGAAAVDGWGDASDLERSSIVLVGFGPAASGLGVRLEAVRSEVSDGILLVTLLVVPLVGLLLGLALVSGALLVVSLARLWAVAKSGIFAIASAN